MANQPKKYKKFVATAATATLVASAIVPVASAASFTDVKETSEFYPYIQEATDELKLFKDTEKFNPNNNITRGQVVLILGRYLEGKGYAPAADYKTNPAFADLKTTSAEENLKYASIVKEAKVFTGSNGNIVWNNNITRQQMAKVLNGLAAEAAGLSLVDVAEFIEDEKVADLASAQTEYRAAIQALRDLEITTVDNFRPTENLTRAQFAKFIVLTNEAIEAILEEDFDAEEIIKAVQDAVAALPKAEEVTAATAAAAQTKVDAANKAIAAAEKALTDNAAELTAEQKAQAEAAIKSAKEAVAKVETAIAATKPVTVSAVSAINANTVKVTGEGLKNLTAEDITLAGNTVTSVTPAADGKTAEVKLATALLPNEKYTVSVKDSVETKSYEVTFEIAVKGVEFVDAKFDNDTKNQNLQIKLDGVVADFDSLAVAGYTVEFNIFDKDDANVNSDFFLTSNASPALKDSLVLGDYTVEVTVRKDGQIVTSDKGSIKVRNLELTTSAIARENFTNSNTDVAVQKSTTLVTGESITLGSLITVNNGVSARVAYSSSDIVITSSNESIISVNGDTLTANTPGKVDIIVSYGDVEKKISYTVTNTDRVLTKVTSNPTSTTVIVGKDTNVVLTAVDQFGDSLEETFAVEYPANGIVDTTTTSVTTGAQSASSYKGQAVFTVDQTGSVFGSGNILFKDSKGKTIGSLAVKTTQTDNQSKKVVEQLKDTSALTTGVEPLFSVDASLDLAADKYAEYAYNAYTSENVPNGYIDLTGYTVTYNSDVVVPSTAYNLADSNDTAWTFETADQGQVTDTLATDKLLLNAVGEGSTDVAIYDTTGKLVNKFRVTVTNSDYKITKVDFKQQKTIDYASKEVNYADFLTITSTSVDDIVKGITLNKPTANVIRISKTTGELYIDADGDGAYDSGEKILGEAVLTVATGATGTLSGGTDYTTTQLVPGSAALTTASSDKGTLIFKIVDDNNKVIASTSVKVDVK